ncbi:Listeria/Bacterioides repeat-containing protein [Hymenobacter daecheongensis DSM 21074]|uniref:Listeria/Bacterioides repeat-containing protein n=2 Tax=Hymenobacter daecheongensis TaxID=496053 RepID=A0A1M6KL17_9BACT|nr:Listeria/Bacterioides repeat-containing protein [Hymenobacter daecheongensis DSM 21074]
MRSKPTIIAWALLLLAVVFSRPLLAQAPPAGFTSSVVSSGWNEAVGLAFNKTGTKMFVWERPGQVWVVESGQKRLLLDIGPEVGAWEDHGLLGFALDPNFDTNGYLYLLYVVDRHHLMKFGTPAYSATTDEYFSATIGRLTRYTATSPTTSCTVDPSSRKILLGATKSTGIPSTFNGHVTNALVFGTDGTLLISTGDGAHPFPDYGAYNATYAAQALADGIITSKEDVGSFRAQMVNCLSGKILRINAATGAGIPSNPFYDAANPNAPRSKVWAVGTRNPFRMTLKPGTGSTDPAAANPGVLYVGDVGATLWEEIHVVDKPKQNLGWPLFEGLTTYPSFMTQNTPNLDAPNPQYNIGGCTQQYFYFRDLVKQTTPTGTATFTNPCDNTKTIPATVPTFVHNRPLIDWGHGAGPSRTGIFSGQTAATIDIGAPGSPVSGSQFGGNAATGGVFYPYSDFPAGYQNTYFFGDYVGGWIRNLVVDGSNKPTAVRDFVNTGAVPVAFAVSPAETGLFYVNFYPSEIRKITYGTSGNTPPVAVASSDKKFGTSPLMVQFTGSASSDPDGQALTYLWNFGDGTTSTVANPTHTFTTATSAPTKYTVTLTVKDPQNNTNQTSLVISANNTPPQVTITSPAPNTLYPLTGNTTYNLRATVTDAEHSAAQLSYQWQTILHHSTHQHPDPINTNVQPTTTIAPYGCGAETYYYRITLTVTDAAGLATTKEVRLDPDCTTTSFTLVDADTNEDIQAVINGTVLNLATLPTRNLNIRANANPATTGSVLFSLSGTETRSQLENVTPYALFSDVGGDYNSWTPAVGSYSLTATPYSASGGGGTAAPALTANFTVTDQAAPVSYTLTANTSGTGTVSKSPNQATYLSGTNVTLTATPGAGQQFTGWSGDATGTTNPLTVSMTANKIITATFAPIPVSYTLTATASGSGTVSKSPDQASYGSGTVVTVTATPAAGFTFAGWSGAATGTANPLSVTMDANKSLTATFTATTVSYTLTTTTSGTGAVSRSPDQATYLSGTNVTLTATPGAGQQFTGWSGGATGTTNPLTVSMTSNKTITATFAPIPASYTLTVTTSGTGTVSKNPNQATYVSGTNVTLTATPGAGQQFTGWSGGATGTTNPLTVSMTANRTITATFAPIPAGQSLASFTLVNADTDQDIQTLTTGATLNLAALPTRNLNVRANTSPATVGSVVFALSGAQVKNQTEGLAPYALFSDAGGDYNPWTPSVGSYSLTATPYSASGGTGTAGTPLTISFTVQDVAAPGPFTLTVTTSGTGTVSKNPDQATYPSGTNVTLTATPGAGQQFTGWSGGATGTTNPLTVSMTANRAITATFATVNTVASFTLVNAATDQDIQPLTTGATLNLATLPSQSLNIRANTSPATVGSVVFALSGAEVKNQTESVAPYALFSDAGGDYNPWTPPVGSYSLTATPYSAGSGAGTAGIPLTVSFTVISQVAPAAPLASGLQARAASRPAQVFPNPSASGRFVVRVAEPLAGEVAYTLLSSVGAVVATGRQQLEQPQSALSFDFAQQMPAAGLYYLLLQNGGHTIQLKVVRN